MNRRVFAKLCGAAALGLVSVKNLFASPKPARNLNDLTVFIEQFTIDKKVHVSYDLGVNPLCYNDRIESTITIVFKPNTEFNQTDGPLELIIQSDDTKITWKTHV